MGNINYWGFRIDKNNTRYLLSELYEGRLRQGWGWDEKQNLKLANMMDGGARRNLAMLKVKKGDILLVPRIPGFGEVALVEATEDWDKGYRFLLDSKIGDFGHVFPAKFLRSFVRTNKYASGTIRATLKNVGRFWNINHCSKDVELLLSTSESELKKQQRHEDRFFSSIEVVFNETFDSDAFKDKLYDKIINQFSHAEWEDALVAGLKKIYPEPQFLIEKVGGIKEKDHGTDILIRIPALINDYQYGIAIQVKDYTDTINGDVIKQIDRSSFWENDENLKIIDKIVILTKVKEEHNLTIKENESGVRFIFAHQLKELLGDIAKSHIGIKSLN